MKRWKVEYSVLPIEGEPIDDSFIVESFDIGEVFRWGKEQLAEKYPPETVREVVIWDIGIMNNYVFTQETAEACVDIPAEDEWSVHVLMEESNFSVDYETGDSPEPEKIRVVFRGLKQHVEHLRSLYQEEKG